MKRTVAAVLLLLLALSVVAEGGRKDDFEFAQGLVDMKYYDLAQEQFEAIISDGSRSADERAAGALGLALLMKAQALDARLDTTKEKDDVLKLFDAAENLFDQFLRNNRGHARSVDAKFEVGLLLQAKGTYLSDLREDHPDDSSLKSTAESAFDQSIDLFKSVADSLANKVDDMDEGDPDFQRLDWDARRAAYFHAVCYYSKGLLYEPGGAERQGTLSKAIIFLTDFVWVNEENILGGYAYLHLGLSHQALDSPADAIEWLSTAFAGIIPDQESEPFKYILWTDLYLQGYHKLISYCNELGKRDGTDYREDFAKIYGQEMLDQIKDADSRRAGHLAIMEYARTLMLLGEYDQAMALATRISQRGQDLSATTEWGAITSFRANKLLNEIIAAAGIGGEELSLPPDVLVKAATGRMLSEDWGQAIRAFQLVIQSCTTEEQIKEYAIPAWMDIGQCYYRQDQFLEACFAFETVVKRYRKTDEVVAGDAAYKNYRAASALFSSTKDKADEKRKKSARSRFAEEFSAHPRAIDLQYYEGADYITDGDAARSVEAKAPFYEKALDRLVGVKKTSILYAKALARIGEVYYRLDRLDDSLKQFKGLGKYIQAPANATPRPATQGQPAASPRPLHLLLRPVLREAQRLGEGAQDL